MKKIFARDLTIGTKLSMILFISILISTLSVGVFCYHSYKVSILEQTGQRALAIAQSIASGIDGDKYILYSKTGIKDVYYDQIKGMMSNAKERNGVATVYSMIDDGDKYKYIVSGYMKNEDQNKWGYLGYTDSQNVFSKEPALVLKDGLGRYTKAQDYGSKFGLLVSGFAPILDSKGNVAGIVGTDISCKESIAKLHEMILILAMMIVNTSILLFTGFYLIIKQMISSPLREISEKCDLLVLGDTEVQINEEFLNRTDEIGSLSRGFIGIAVSTKEQAEVCNKIASGDLALDLIPRSEKDVLTISMASIIKTLNNLVTETGAMTKAAVEGELEKRGDEEKFHGGYGEIIHGLNSALDAIIEPLRFASSYIQRLSNGEHFDIKEHNFRGEYGVLIQSLSMVKESLHTLTDETKKLTAAAVNGDLSYRADLGKLKGNYAELLDEINKTLDSLTKPLNMAANYIQRIGEGEIPSKITDEYKGDFNEIKHSINSCIDGLGGLEEGRDILKRMSLNDYTLQVEGIYKGIFEEIKDSINGVSDRIRSIIRFTNNIANGDLQDLSTLKDIGKRSENDTLVPAYISMMETITAMVDETMVLSEASVQGRLSIRGDAERFKGEYAKVIEGINKTLDAVIEPIHDASAVLQEIAKGNLQMKMEGEYLGDHAEIKTALNETVENIRSYVNEISNVLAEISGGNLNVAITADYMGDFIEIKDSLNNIVQSLNQVLGEINEAADQVASGAQQVSEGSQTLAHGSTEQASSIQQLTSSITEIATQVKQNAINANLASELASFGKNNADKGNYEMNELLNSMAEINESSNNISKIIKVIDDIAFQTNILALNAAVEAARAGQHGKGFAVVSEEVRNLAIRSAAAAQETTALIEGSISRVQTGTRNANDTAVALVAIVEGAEKMVDLLGGIANASNEQASAISQIDKSIEQVSMVVQNNSATTEESAAASEQLSGQAGLLKSMVGKFELISEVIALPSTSRDDELDIGILSNGII